MQFGSLTLKRCRYGWMLFSGPYIGKCFELYGQYSESEVEIMRTFIRPGDTVIDIGANIGDLTLPMAQLTGAYGHVYAMESHPDIFNILCANLALNQLSHVQPINAFVKNDPAAEVQAQFVKTGVNHKTIKIDDLGLTQCRLIKIDVDGNELDVLQSGAATLSKHRPILYLENDIRPKSKDLLTYLFSLDYDLYWHIAPIFSADNFFGNSVNHWHPQGIVSLMVLAVPKEQASPMPGLAQIHNADEWPI